MPVERIMMHLDIQDARNVLGKPVSNQNMCPLTLSPPPLHSCCTATDILTSVLPSCSRPGSIFGSVENGGFCPSPPSLSASDVGATATASGTLDAINTYVAEQLLIRSLELDEAVFFRRYLAGFTLAAQDPVFSVCNCQRPQAGAVPGACTLLDNFLKPCVNESCLSYSAKAAVCPSNDSIPLCDRPAEACYSVDGFSADITRVSPSIVWL